MEKTLHELISDLANIEFEEPVDEHEEKFINVVREAISNYKKTSLNSTDIIKQLIKNEDLTLTQERLRELADIQIRKSQQYLEKQEKFYIYTNLISKKPLNRGI